MSVLADLKTIFMGERLDPSDLVPRKLLKEIATIPRLAGIMPYSSWLPEEKLFVLDHGAFSEKPTQNLGFCIETPPQTGSNEEMERVLTSLFLSCPAGTGIQITLYASPHILPVLRKQSEMLPVDLEEGGLRSTNTFRELSRRRIDYYLQNKGRSFFSNHAYLLRDFRCVVSVTLPLNPMSVADIEEAIRIRESVHSVMRSSLLPGFDWQPEDLINFVADFFDHERILGSRRRLIEYDNSLPIRSHISSTEIASAVADSCIKQRKNGDSETALQCFSVTQYPKYFRLGNMDALIGDYFRLALAIPCPFLITMGAVVQDYESARTRATVKAARATQAAESVMAKFQPDLQDKKRDWDMVLRAFSNGRNIVQMYHQVVLVSHLEDASRCEHAVRSVWQARGIDLSKDVYLQHHALVAGMPCALTQGMQADLKTFGRIGTKTSDNAIMTSPLLAEWKGSGTPVMTLFGRRGQIMSLDLFDNKSGNFNFAVAALSGSGKSVLINEMAFRYLGTGAKVWIIDIGRSYKNLCEILDGEFIEFTDERHNRLCLNPFSMVMDINSDMEMLLPLVAQMASPQEKLDNYSYSLLVSAIKRVWESKGKFATITDIYDFLKNNDLSENDENIRDMHRLATALEPYTKHGVYASYFEGESNIQFTSNFVVLELEELKSKKNLQTVVMQLVMYRITQEMYLDRSLKKIVIIDEAWDLMGAGSSASFIEAGYRRARKYGGAFGTITQSVDDYYKSEATRAMIENADWLFLLRQKAESIERLGKEGKLTLDEYTKRQMTSVNTEHGMYSEIYVHCPIGSGVGRLILDPFSMLLYSTRAQDYEAIKLLTNQGIAVTDAIEMILDQRRSA